MNIAAPHDPRTPLHTGFPLIEAQIDLQIDVSSNSLLAFQAASDTRPPPREGLPAPGPQDRLTLLTSEIARGCSP